MKVKELIAVLIKEDQEQEVFLTTEAYEYCPLDGIDDNYKNGVALGSWLKHE